MIDTIVPGELYRKEIYPYFEDTVIGALIRKGYYPGEAYPNPWQYEHLPENHMEEAFSAQYFLKRESGEEYEDAVEEIMDPEGIILSESDKEIRWVHLEEYALLHNEGYGEE